MGSMRIMRKEGKVPGKTKIKIVETFDVLHTNSSFSKSFEGTSILKASKEVD